MLPVLTPDQRALRERIAHWSPDAPNAALPFSNRLARENGWSPAYARRVTDEYKKFIFLAVCAGHPVTPSEAVDQAWHLHLTYTHSYWEELCGTILGKKLHHTPTQGGTSEDRKFHNWYERTRESYQQFFGALPPADIWPPVHERFRRSSHRWVNTSRVWLIPKPRISSKPVFSGVAGLTAGLMLAGCIRSDNPEPVLVISLIFITVFLVVSFVIIQLSTSRKRQQSHRRSSRSSSSDRTYDTSSSRNYSGSDSTGNTSDAAAAGFAGFAGGAFGGGGAGDGYGDSSATDSGSDAGSSDSSGSDGGSSGCSGGGGD